MTSPLIEENSLLRRIEAIELWQREFPPSIVKSVQSIVAGLIRGGYANQSQETGFALATSSALATVTSTTIQVPEGYSRGIILATGWCYAYNGTGSTDYLQVGVSVNGDTPAWLTVNPGTASGSTASTQVIEITYHEGLTPGGTVTIDGVASSYGATPWGTSTNMYIQGFAIFFT